MLSVAPYASAILSWEWINGDGELIDVFKLDDDYIRSISRYCSQRVIEAKNDAERDTWQQWVIFTARVLAGRRALAAPLASESGEVQTHGDKRMKCHCGKIYRTRQSYLNRGQGYSCSKSCAAKRRANALPRATVAELFKHKDHKDVE